MASISGGNKLATVLAKVAANAANAKSVDVGFLSGSTYPDGTSVPMVAAINEFGRPDIGQPPRPFFRNMIAAKSGEWPKAVAGLLKANDYDAHKTLDQAGAAIGGQLKNSIATFSGVPLKPSTIARKGFQKELIDTSVMIGSIDHRVD